MLPCPFVIMGRKHGRSLCECRLVRFVQAAKMATQHKIVCAQKEHTSECKHLKAHERRRRVEAQQQRDVLTHAVKLRRSQVKST